MGPVALVAHLTPGHSRGCTSWEIPVREGGRALRVVSACSLVRLGVAQYAGQAADLAGTFRTPRALRADVWVTSHGRLWGRYRKFAARGAGGDPTTPFVDPAGYRAYVDSGEAEWRRGVVH